MQATAVLHLEPADGSVPETAVDKTEENASQRAGDEGDGHDPEALDPEDFEEGDGDGHAEGKQAGEDGAAVGRALDEEGQEEEDEERGDHQVDHLHHQVEQVAGDQGHGKGGEGDDHAQQGGDELDGLQIPLFVADPALGVGLDEVLQDHGSG